MTKTIKVEIKKLVTMAELGLGVERPLNKEKRYWIKKLTKNKKQAGYVNMGGAQQMTKLPGND